MCGRYAATANPDELVEEFEIDEITGEIPAASWNVAPTDQVPVVVERRDPENAERIVRRLSGFRWGLVPSWAKDIGIGARMINARVETVAEKPAFRKAFSVRRCLIPADGYYEWYTPEQSAASGGPKVAKQPFFIHRGDDLPLVMAGLYEFWKSPDDAWVRSCTIITTSATDALGHIHDRMPMVIGPESWDAWLDPALTEPDQALELLGVTESDQLEAYAVGRAVGNVRNNGPELVVPLAES